MRSACGRGGVSEGIADAPVIAIRQRHHKGLRASHWQPGTCGADDALGLVCAK